jgi:uncharacterized protein (TIGR00255 family)
MTGFATLSGAAAGTSWAWEARSVNGRGLDIRPRLPDGFDSLEPALRAEMARVLNRGSVTVTLKFARGGTATGPRLNPAALAAAMDAIETASGLAAERGLGLAPATIADLLVLRGVLEAEAASAAESEEVLEAASAQIPALAAALGAARAAEGAGLLRLLAERVDRLAELSAAARESDAARAGRRGKVLRERVAALLGATQVVDEARLAQELALLAVRADISEELGRLETHIAAARDMLASGGPIGRRLDFLTQELNREANTLCSKSADAGLTAVGLEMKVVIDQLREQVQNVE